MESNTHKNLGNKEPFKGLEALRVNTHCKSVTLISDEVTALCPVTSQPDQYTVEITIMGAHSIESKSLKLYFQEFRNKGIFCENFAGQILHDVKSVLPEGVVVWVVVTQKARGGISIIAEARS